jgi:hypothetical protein
LQPSLEWQKKNKQPILDEQELLVLLIAVATLIFKYKRPVPDQ